MRGPGRPHKQLPTSACATQHAHRAPVTKSVSQPHIYPASYSDQKSDCDHHNSQPPQIHSFTLELRDVHKHRGAITSNGATGENSKRAAGDAGLLRSNTGVPPDARCHSGGVMPLQRCLEPLHDLPCPAAGQPHHPMHLRAHDPTYGVKHRFGCANGCLISLLHYVNRRHTTQSAKAGFIIC